MLRVEWTEPVDFNGVFQTYTALVSVKEGSNAKLHNTTDLQWTVSGLGKFSISLTNETLYFSLSAPYTPYEISVSAVNGAGVGETQTVTEFSVEGGSCTVALLKQ